MNSTSPFRFERMASNAAAGSPTARKKGDIPPGVRPGQTDPPPVPIDSSSLRSYPCASRSARAFRRALTYSFELCPAVLHGGAVFMTCVRRVSESTEKNPERLGGSQSVGLFPEGVAGLPLAQPASLNGFLFGSKRDRKIAASIGSWKQ